jgi:5-methylcytosine-specific restriction endonuclease McrA
MQRIPPPEDKYPEVLERTIEALLEDGRAAGRRELADIADHRYEVLPRRTLPRPLQAEVFMQDRFQCRYCGAKLIPNSLMELISEFFPKEFPYHPNWKGGQTHPAFVGRSLIVDHVDPISGGGPELDRENLVTACWPCNARKANLTLDRLDWRRRKRVNDPEWDGLTRHYPRLWRLAKRPKPQYHRSWIRAFHLDPDG